MFREFELKIVILVPTVGKTFWQKIGWQQEAVSEFTKKISYWYDIELIGAKTSGIGRENPEHKRRIDTESILSQIQPADYCIILDERGKTLSSEEFSKTQRIGFESGKKRLVYIIGGPYGLDQKMIPSKNIISLSKMVLNHHVATIMLLEQIYRGLTISHGIPYHNE